MFIFVRGCNISQCPEKSDCGFPDRTKVLKTRNSEGEQPNWKHDILPICQVRQCWIRVSSMFWRRSINPRSVNIRRRVVSVVQFSCLKPFNGKTKQTNDLFDAKLVLACLAVLWMVLAWFCWTIFGRGETVDSLASGWLILVDVSTRPTDKCFYLSENYVRSGFFEFWVWG